MSALNPLRQHRQSLWHLELAGWLHNLGKLHEDFVAYQRNNNANAYRYEFIGGRIVERLPPDSSGAGALGKASRYAQARYTAAKFRESTNSAFEPIFAASIDLPGDAPTRVGEVIDFQNGRWHSPEGADLWSGGQSPLWAFLLSIAHRQASGGDKTELDREVDGVERRDEVDAALNRQGQNQSRWQRSTAFGYESELDESRYASACQAVAKVIVTDGPSAKSRARLFAELNAGMAESRRPLHDVRIGDMGKMAAAFLKAQAARFLIEKPATRGALQWRLVRFAVDGPGFVERVSRIPDILARRAQINQHLDAIRLSLEDSTPLGNEVYRDEYGSVFVFADYGHTVDDDPRLRELLSEALPPAPEDFSPEVQIGSSFAMGTGFGNSFVLGNLLDRPVPSPHPQPAAVRTRWSGLGQREICTVCGVNPIASKDGKPHAFAQRACGTCFDRRVGRSHEWLAQPGTTIWLDEIGDRNGRLALLVARLRLGPWLTQGGAIDQTLVMAHPENLPSVMRGGSAARISRVWETCRDFWQNSLTGFRAEAPVSGRVRLFGDFPDTRGFRSGQAFLLIPQAPALQNLKISVVYHQETQSFLVADNLERHARIAGLKSDERFDWAQIGAFALHQPTGYGSPDRALGTFFCRRYEFEAQPYAPLLSLLEDPQLFMALVPADRALAHAGALRDRYALEMAKVRPVLGLDLGVVWAPLETPVYALIDAGRRMLRRQLTPQPVAHSALGFTLSPDHFHLVPRHGAAPAPASALTPEDVLAIEPSTFDFEFLESAGRRFELAYGPGHQRQGAEVSHRPYQLHELDLWEATRELLARYLHLGRTEAKIHQLKALDGILETKRQLWRASWADLDETFVYWALLNVEWGASSPAEEELQILVRAIRRGIFADLLEVELGVVKAGRTEHRKELAYVS